MRRVVISGLGVVSCLGNSKAEVLDSLRAGRSGITFNEAYKESGMRSHVSGSINLDINEMIDAWGKKIDLVLSGHTHGGQVVLPFIGVPYMPSKYGSKYAEGLVEDGERQTYITRGVGHLIRPNSSKNFFYQTSLNNIIASYFFLKSVIILIQ